MGNPEVVAALTDMADVAATYAGLWVSVSFAYLTVAYLVGRRMTRFQCGLISALYLVTATMFAAASMAHSHAFFLALNATTTV